LALASHLLIAGRMRSFACLIVLLASCRIDVGGNDNMGPDAGDGSGSGSGSASPSCQEATQHSDLAWIQTNVFSVSCNFGGCHKAPASNAGNLVLEAGMSHDALVGKAAQTESGWTRVVPGDMATSYLLVAIGNMPGPKPVGGLMPLSSPELCTEKQEAIARWIAAGAQND
jgi:hypothetical protein